MDITYSGNASFLIKGEQTVAINPTAKGDRNIIALHSQRQRSKRLIINGPGEYEIGGVLIETVECAKRLGHAIGIDDVNVLVLTNPAALSDRDVERIGPVDVLVIGTGDLPVAQKTLADLTPRVVLPFGPHAVELCAVAGVKDVAPQSRFTWNGQTSAAKAVLLKAPRTRKNAA